MKNKTTSTAPEFGPGTLAPGTTIEIQQTKDYLCECKIGGQTVGLTEAGQQWRSHVKADRAKLIIDTNGLTVWVITEPTTTTQTTQNP